MKGRDAVRRKERGITLVEAMVSLAIVAAAVIPAMTALGGATDNVIRTRDRRKLRYLSQILIADIERSQVKTHPDEEGEGYEEGDSGTFEGYESSDRPGEYAAFEWVIEVLREVMVTGGGGDLESFGFADAGEGPAIGRPVSNDLPLGEGEEEAPPEGQVKRVLVVAIRRVGEDADDDRTLRIMTYLPSPGEEEQVAAAGAAGAGLPGGAGPTGAGGALPTGGGGRGGSTSDRRK